MANELVLGVDLEIQGGEQALQKRLAAAGKIAGDGFAAQFVGEFVNVAKLTGGVAVGTIVADILKGTFAAVKNVFQDSVKEFRESESALKVLSSALEGTRASGQSAISSIQTLADELEILAGIDDKVVLKNAALIQSLANLNENGLKLAIKGAADLAAGLQISFESAADLIARVGSGGIEPFNRALKKYGITIDENTPKSQALAIALEKINEKFGGRAVKDITDYDKAINSLNANIEIFLTNIGRAVTGSSLVQSIIKGSGAVLSKINEAISLGATGLIAKNLIETTQAAQASLRTLKEIESVASSIASKGPTAEERSDALKRLGTLGLSEIKRAEFERQQAIDQLNREQELIGIEEFNSRKEQIELDHQIRLGQIKKEQRSYQEQYDKEANNQRLVNMQAAAQAINQAIAKSTSMGIQALTKSLVLGQEGFKDFHKKLAGTLGQMSIQIGEVLIAAGIGMAALGSISPAAAIGAGAALVAIGTILSSFSGGEGGAGPIGGPNSFTPAATAQTSPQERVEPETRVNITVQGDILDSDETGLRIAKIIKEASLNNNIKIFGAV